MKVFLGWSGETSHKIALAFHDWLPKVIQAIKPYISSEDIAKGARWSTDIANELQATNYGIICVTKENVGSPWINFESGALSREIEKSFVTPFLFQLRPSDIQGPLAQFQAVINEKDDMLKLVSSINDRQETDQRLEKTNLQAAFEMWWSQLCEKLQSIDREEGGRHTLKKRDTHEILEELLDLVRAQQRGLMQAWESDDYKQSQMVDALLTRFQDLAATVTALTRSVEAIHLEDALQRAGRIASGGAIFGRPTVPLSDLLNNQFKATGVNLEVSARDDEKKKK